MARRNCDRGEAPSSVDVSSYAARDVPTHGERRRPTSFTGEPGPILAVLEAAKESNAVLPQQLWVVLAAAGKRCLLVPRSTACVPPKQGNVSVRYCPIMYTTMLPKQSLAEYADKRPHRNDAIFEQTKDHIAMMQYSSLSVFHEQTFLIRMSRAPAPQ